MSGLAALWRGVSTLVLIVGGILLTFGIPATVVLGLRPRSEFIARFIISGGLYLLGGVLLHPEAWARTPFTYPAIRAPMMASLPIAAGTAVWG
jgi:hypothetical protein